ncbi:MAG: hypothetical protein ACOX3A_04750 [bacterium]|jgi:hypothetical protein
MIDYSNDQWQQNPYGQNPCPYCDTEQPWGPSPWGGGGYYPWGGGCYPWGGNISPMDGNFMPCLQMEQYYLTREMYNIVSRIQQMMLERHRTQTNNDN